MSLIKKRNLDVQVSPGPGDCQPAGKALRWWREMTSSSCGLCRSKWTAGCTPSWGDFFFFFWLMFNIQKCNKTVLRGSGAIRPTQTQVCQKPHRQLHEGAPMYQRRSSCKGGRFHQPSIPHGAPPPARSSGAPPVRDSTTGCLSRPDSHWEGKSGHILLSLSVGADEDFLFRIEKIVQEKLSKQSFLKRWGCKNPVKRLANGNSGFNKNNLSCFFPPKQNCSLWKPRTSHRPPGKKNPQVPLSSVDPVKHPGSRRMAIAYEGSEDSRASFWRG